MQFLQQKSCHRSRDWERYNTVRCSVNFRVNIINDAIVLMLTWILLGFQLSMKYARDCQPMSHGGRHIEKMEAFIDNDKLKRNCNLMRAWEMKQPVCNKFVFRER